MPYFSAIALTVSVIPGQRNHLLLGDQPQGLVLSGCRAALVVGEDNFDFGPAQTGKAGIFRKRKGA
jgi:hypothetical protein